MFTMSALSQELLNKAMDAAFEVQQRAYCPYSKFRVGCALVCDDDTIIQGCNVENASYGGAICAERGAVCSAVAGGRRKFKAFVIVSDLKDKFIRPCGLCRQVILEFGECEIICVKKDRTFDMKYISQLMPHSFSKEDLSCERI